MMFSIALVGHVDHGKSTLIGRLLYDTNSLPEGKIDEIKKTCEALGKNFEFAYVVDALEEERKNQMTIETSQTFFKTQKREYALIDAPGHKEFIKNMVTGASQADASILIVDVKEGVKEQTRRHAYLLKFLDALPVIVCINKMDLVNYSEKEYLKAKKEIEDYLKLIGIKPIAIIPISAYAGDNVVKKSKNMPWYDGLTLTEVLDSLDIKSKREETLFFVQEKYKDIYLGNLLSGSIKGHQKLFVLPENKEVEVGRIVYGENEVEEVKAPKAIGITCNKELRRGNLLVKDPNQFHISRKINAVVFVLSDKIKKNESYTLRLLTQETIFRVRKIREKIDIDTLERKEAKELKELDAGIIEIETEKPLAFTKSVKEVSRFVILKKGKILAGGKII